VGSLITGLLGLLVFPASIAAVVLGHMSRSEIRKSAGRLKGSGMALAGLILGYSGLSLIPIAIILIIAAIAIPNLLRARIAANEAAAASVIRTINGAELSYRHSFPSVGYTCSLASLGGDEHSPTSAEHAHFVDGVIAAGRKNGYRFEIQNCTASDGVTQTYQVVAYPEAHNKTGVRAFCSDQSAAIRVDPKGSTDDCLASGSVLQ
jgi:type IV pilus assembly protein PilA